MTSLSVPPLKETGIPWLGKVPANWTVQAIKHASYIKARVGWKGLTSDEFETTAHAYLVTGTDFRGRFINWSTCYQVGKERYLDDPFIQLRDGDLLVTKDGTIGKLSMVSDLDKPACLNSGIFLVRPLKSYSTRFLYWVLSSRVFDDFIALTSTGSTILHLYQNVFEQFRFAYPPLEVQDEIADYLDQETARIDNLILKQMRLIELLAEKRQAVITHAVTKGLDPSAPAKPSGTPWQGPIPEHWVVQPLKNLIRMQTGVTLGKDFSNEITQTYAYLRVANVQIGYVDLGDVKEIDLPQAVAASSMLQPGDVLMTEGGDRDKLARGCIWDAPISPCVHQNHIFAVRTGSKLLNEFLVLALDAAPARTYFYITGKQSTNLASTNSTTVRNFRFGVPPISEQRAIVDHLRTKTLQIDDLMQKASAVISMLKERRSALISAAVTGKIDVRQEASQL